MTENHQEKAANAWLLVENSVRQSSVFNCPQFAIELVGEGKFYAAVADGDWLAVASASGVLKRIARVLRVRSDLEKTTFYFDRLQTVDDGTALGTIGLALP